MNNLFPNTRTYRGDRYDNVFGQTECRKVCIDSGDCSRYGTGLSKPCMACKEKCKDAGGLAVLLGGGGGDGTGGGGGGNGGGGNGGGGNGGGANGNGEGPDTKTIMVWAGVALLLIALIIGGAIAIKKIRT